jgi:cytochrome c biogenesis protein CcdA
MNAADAGFALLLGAVAAFNPCGFALLPAYITVIVTGTAASDVPASGAMRRAVGFGVAMTVGFVAVFAAFGLLFGGLNAALQGSILPYTPYFTTVLGIALVVLGAIMLRHGELRGPALGVRGRAPGRDFWSQTLYGATFAIASLSCTIGPFLAVVTMSLSASNPAGAVAPFVIYAVGMGTAVLAVSLIAVFAGASAAGALRRHTPLIVRIGGGLMVVAGLYVALFGLAEVLSGLGVRTLDPVLLTTARWQGAVVTWVQGLGTPVLLAAAAVVLAAVVAVVLLARRREATRARIAVEAPPES